MSKGCPFPRCARVTVAQRIQRLVLAALALLLGTISQTALADTAVVAAGSAWRYLDNGIDQGTSWRSPGFDDSSWKAGAAELGYGDGGEKTVIGYGGTSTNKSITSYFRLRFSVHSDIWLALTTCCFCYQLGVLYLPVFDLPQTVFQP